MSGSSSNIKCPKCGSEITLRGKAMTVAIACPSCHIYYCIGDWNDTTYQFNFKATQEIPLGAKGRFDNFLYEVMGFVVKEERKWHYRWKEYLLFNPYRGYAFLSEHGGHWNFIWPLESDPVASKQGKEFYFEEERYRLYQKYKAQVVYARGEFFFDVVGITYTTHNEDYIAPPYLLTLEKSEDSILWCKGEYFSRNEIASIFSIPREKLPPPDGMGYTQPTGGSFTPKSLTIATFAALFLLIFIQIFFAETSEEKVVFHGSYNETDLKEDKMFVTPTFQLSEGQSSVEFYIEAPVENDWFYGEFSLVNEDTGVEYNFSKDIEFYYGYEGGERWSEGAKVGNAYISQIPGGKYHVNIYPQFSTASKYFSIIITRDVPTMSNFWFAGLALLIYPLIYFIRYYHRERKRWEDSDYSPYE